MPAQWDQEVDVLVVGSGAAGLSASVVAATGAAQVLVIEKSELIGGTSATSGGGVWIPSSPLAAAAGFADTSAEAFQYLRALTAPNISDERIMAFVEGAPAMLRWMAEHTGLRFISTPYPDYHPELPGGKTGWRTHFPVEFDGRVLGDDVNLIREESPAASFLGLINWTLLETQALLHRPPGWRWVFIKMLLRYARDIRQRLRSRRDRFLSLGNAIIGQLKLAADRLQVPIWRHTALLELIQENGVVVGAIVSKNDRRLRIRARRAVVLAGGGFERNAGMRALYLPAAAADPGMSGSQINNQGECINIAKHIGAATMNMDSAWWAPVFKVPGEERGRLCAVERALPGCIIVNQRGQRYMNETASYHVAAQTMMAEDRPDTRTVPSYILFDSRYRKFYPMGPLLPLPLWLHSPAIRSTVIKAQTIAELAEKIQIAPQVLEGTIERFNRGASAGSDPDFHRGASEYDRYYGDPKVQPNPTLAPLATAPFYAMRLYLGDIGTNGGLCTDANARVLDNAGAPIPGLYAAGNTTASVMGHCYPGAGGTLGPAMTFGYLAGLAALSDVQTLNAKTSALA